MGFADALIRMGIAYDSDEVIAFGRKLMQFVDVESKKESQRLAEERGAFPESAHSIWGPDATAAKDADGGRSQATSFGGYSWPTIGSIGDEKWPQWPNVLAGIMLGSIKQILEGVQICPWPSRSREPSQDAELAGVGSVQASQCQLPCFIATTLTMRC
jgi:ribonucleotide reductase alpha subunit